MFFIIITIILPLQIKFSSKTKVYIKKTDNEIKDNNLDYCNLKYNELSMIE